MAALTDLLFQRFIEVWSGMPQLFMLIILASIIEPGFWTLLIFLLLFSWMGLTGVVRAEFLRGRNLDYVRAARALGVSDTRLMARHILPNAMVATLTFLPFILSAGPSPCSPRSTSSASACRLARPRSGELLAQGKNNLQAPWLAFTGFVVLGGVLTLLIFVGEAVRDAFDPRKLPGVGDERKQIGEKVFSPNPLIYFSESAPAARRIQPTKMRGWTHASSGEYLLPASSL